MRWVRVPDSDKKNGCGLTSDESDGYGNRPSPSVSTP